jgi:hypothetical protein
MTSELGSILAAEKNCEEAVKGVGALWGHASAIRNQVTAVKGFGASAAEASDKAGVMTYATQARDIESAAGEVIAGIADIIKSTEQVALKLRSLEYAVNAYGVI